tara:strand:+ start:11381 stop:15946 length:4566 start_codon:yes stop_codon:yes gene_type:complete
MPYQYINTQAITQASTQVSAQYYSDLDITSLGGQTFGYMLHPVFGKSPFDRVEYHVYDPAFNRLFSNHQAENWTVDVDSDGMPQIHTRLKEDVDGLNLVNGAYSIIYNFHRDAIGGPEGVRFKIHSISKNRQEIRLVPTVFEDSQAEAGPKLEEFYSRFQQLKSTSGVTGPFTNRAGTTLPSVSNNPLWTQLQVNFGYNRIGTVVSWLIDDIFPYSADTPRTILLKLYQPIPSELLVDSQCWLLAEATQPVSNKIILDKPAPLIGTHIASPNFDLALDTTPHLQTEHKSYNTILGVDTDVQSDIQNAVSSSLDGMRLNIDYSVFENYIQFGSAEERVKNFRYKLHQINQYDSQARKFDHSEHSTSDVYIYEYTGSHGSKYVKQYQKRWVDKKVKLINEFDDFEKWLYFESGSNSSFIISSGSRGGDAHDWSRSVITPFPKLSGSFKNDRWTDDYYNWNNDQMFDWAVHSIFMPGPNYELLHTTHSKSTDWYSTTIASASAYDKQNQNMLRKTAPEFISDGGRDDNETYLRFLDMSGQAHDIWWSYTRYFNHSTTRAHNTNFANRVGLSDDLVYHVAKSQGLELIDGDPNQELWQYMLGKDSDGHRLQNNPTASIKTLTSKQRTSEIWKRIVNNLPFLLKAKGTGMGVRGLINCYGIPEHILPIYEYGSSKKSTQSGLYQERTFKYCLNFNSQSISTNWGPHHGTTAALNPVRYNVGGSDVIEAVTPNAVEFRFWPENNTLSTVNTSLAYSQSLWQVNNDMGIVLHRNYSDTKLFNGRTEGLTEFGHFSLVMSSSKTAASVGTQTGYHTVSTQQAKIFQASNNKQDGDGWWTVMLNRKPKNNYHSSSMFEYELVAMRSGYGSIDQAVSCSLRVTSSLASIDSGYLSSSINNSWSGSLEPSKKAYLGGYITRSTGLPYSGNPNNHGVFGHQFHGSMQELRYYASPLTKNVLKTHTLAPEMYSAADGTATYSELLLRLKLSDKQNHWSGSKGLHSPSASMHLASTHPNQSTKYTYWDIDKQFTLSASAHNYPNFIQYDHSEEIYYIDTPELGPNNYTSDKIRREENLLIRDLSPVSRAEKPASDKFALDSNNLGIYFSPSDQVNKDIFDHIGGMRLDNYIGDAQQAYEDDYSELKQLNKVYFKKYVDERSKGAYLNELKLYDMSLFTMLKRYLPARANADLGVVIQPHFLERSKASSRGKMGISGDTKPQNIAIDSISFIQAAAPTSINCTQPAVAQLGFSLEPQTTTGAVNPSQPNALMRSFQAEPQQLVPVELNDHKPNSITIDGVIGTNNGLPIFVLGSEPAKTVPKGTQPATQFNASNVPSHQTNSPLSDIAGTIIIGNQVTGTPYSHTSLHKKLGLPFPIESGFATPYEYVEVQTPDWKQSGSMDFIQIQRKSETRMTNQYHYYSASVEYKAGDNSHGDARPIHGAKSASYGKSYENGSSVNLYAYSKSLKPAEVSDYNLGGTTRSNRFKYTGTQINGAGFNIDSNQTPDFGPVVSYTLGDPNTLISSDAGFGGNLSIE